MPPISNKDKEEIMPPLWKIKDESFWLAGTMHFLKKEDYPISDIVQEVINIAKILVLEDKDFLIKGQDLGIYKRGETIHSELSLYAVNLLSEICKQVDLDFKEIQMLRPWKATMVVSATVWKSIGFSIEYGFDKYLLNTFLSSNDQIISLEDSSEVSLFFDRLSRKNQEKMLVSSLENIELIVHQIEGLHKAWKLGSEVLVMKFAHEPLKIIPNLFQQLILDRNVAWLPKIIKLIDKKDPALIAVGAAHLLGESNIIDSLINVGYNIERLA